MHLLYRLVNVINLVCSCGYLFLSKPFWNPNFMATSCINLENILGADFSDQLKYIIRYKRTGYNIHVMRQSACLCNRVHAWWLTQSWLTTSLFNCTPVGCASDVMKAPALKCSIQLVWARCPVSSVSVKVLLLSTHLVSTQCCWILIYICCFDA